MKLTDVISKCDFKAITNNKGDNIDCDGCYVGDLLSLVMSRCSKKNIWITIMNNVNIVAVAVMTECSCIIIPEEIVLSDEVIEKANSQNVCILSSSVTAYETAIKIWKAYNNG